MAPIGQFDAFRSLQPDKATSGGVELFGEAQREQGVSERADRRPDPPSDRSRAVPAPGREVTRTGPVLRFDGVRLLFEFSRRPHGGDEGKEEKGLEGGRRFPGPGRAMTWCAQGRSPRRR